MTLINKIKEFLFLNEGSLKKKIIRSVFWVGLSMIIVSFITVFRSIILARLLTPEMFGLMGICLIVIRGVELFTQTGFSAALIHFQEKFSEAKDTAFSIMAIRGLLLMLITLVISPFIAEYYETDSLTAYIQVASISFFINGFQNINVIGLEKELNFKKLTYLEQINTILSFIFVIVLAYYMRNVWALIYSQLFTSVLTITLSYILLPGAPKFSFNKDIAKKLLKYGKFIAGLTIVIYITTEIDNVIVGKILGMDELGYYLVAYTLANLPATHISKVISKIMFPAYSKLQNDLVNLRKTYLQVLMVVSSLSIPTAVGIFVLAPEIIGVLYGEKWLPAIIPLQILTIFGGFRAIGALNGYLYNAIGKPNIPFYMNLSKLVIILAIIYPLTLKFQLVGVSLAVTVPLVIQFFISVFIFTRVIHLKQYDVYKILFTACAKSAIMFIGIYLLKQQISISISSLIVLIIFGAIIFLGLNYNQLLYLFKQKHLLQ